jgi:hypothetical protein
MHTRHPVDWRSHFPLLLGILAACAFLALLTMLIINLSSVPEGVQPMGDGNFSTKHREDQPARERDRDKPRDPSRDPMINAF